MPPRIKQVCNYLKKTCKILEDLKLITDSRQAPDYTTPMMVAACLLGFLCRTRSTRQMCRRLKKKGWRRFMGLPLTRPTPVEGTFRYFYPRLHTATVRAALVKSVSRMRRAKMHTSKQFDGLRVVSIDGTQPFSTRHFSCEGCIEHQKRLSHADENEPPMLWHDHRIVTARLVGDTFSPWLSFVSQEPETEKGGYEGEQTATPRLLTKLEEDYGRTTIDVILADALHATNPFIQECEKHGWFATFISKGNAKSLQDAFESRPQREPVVVRKKVHEGQVTATIWKQENVYLGTCNLPLQVLKIHQLVETMGGKVLRDDTRWIGSRIPSERLSAEKLWWMGWRRWESENGGHRNFKIEHHANHVFCHHNATAVENILWLLMWGQNLLEAFCLKRLNSGPFPSLKDGLIGVVEELVEGMAANTTHKLFASKELSAGLWKGG